MSEAVLVTGAAGFIGASVAGMLIEQGRDVIGIDNLNDYYDPRLKEWRLEPLKNSPAFSFIEGDIADTELIKRIFRENRIDYVINLAARAGVRASVEDPWVYLETNVKGTLNLLEASRQSGVKTFVLASTSSLYGFNEMPFNEEQKTDSPLAPYGATKKGAEVLCYSYHYLYGLNTIVPRYFTVYGPGGRPDMSIFKFILKIERGRPIPVYGDGRQTRDFTFIDDIARGTLAMLGLEGYEIINLGNDNSVELLYVIGLIEDALGKKAVIDWQERHPADVEATWADIGKARKLLNWEPLTGIEEGIEKTVKWFRDNREFILSLREEQ